MIRRLLTPMRVSVLLLWIAVGFVATQRIANSAPTTVSTPAYSPVTPVRVADTRSCSTYLTHTCGLLHSGAVFVVKTGAPAGTTAVAVNITATGATARTYLSAWASKNISRPSVSILNVDVGQTVANFAIVPVRTDGTFVISTLKPVHVIVDLMGVVAPVAPRLVTVALSVTKAGAFDATGKSVTVRMDCSDSGLGRIDYTSQNVIVPVSGGSATFEFAMQRDLQTHCRLKLAPVGGGTPAWWAYASRPYNAPPSGTYMFHCLLPGEREAYQWRIDELNDPSLVNVDVAHPNGCEVSWGFRSVP